MPDFERLTDQLSIDVAKTPEMRNYRIGFVAGKTRGRLEAVVVFGLATLALVVWVSWSGA